ncbi:MAG: glycosyltransferase family 1 protein [Acidimicrobiales bacterium]
MQDRGRVAVTFEQLWHRVPGGTATSAIQSVRALQRDTDLDLVGVAARHAGPPPPAFAPPIGVHELALPRAALYESWHRLRWPPVEHATGPVDVIHATGMAVPPRTAPLVVTVHDLAFVHDPSHFTRRGLSFFHRSIELAARDADVLVCPSRATLDDAVAQGLPAERLRLVPWGIDVDPAPPGEVARVRAAYRLDRPFVLWVGTIEPRKNVPGLLEAMAHLLDDGEADADLVLVGPEGWNEDVGPWLARLGRRAHVLGFVPPADLPPLYAAADVFCYPSFREGFGLPVLEAMAQGTPVVTSEGTAMAELVADPLDGLGSGDPPGEPAGRLVDPRDPHAIAGALAEVLTDGVVAERAAVAARTRAARCSWARTSAGLVAAYDEARGRPPEPEIGTSTSSPGPLRVRSGTRPRVACNLLWCVPGEVGGSEEYTVRLLRAVADDDHGCDPVLFVNGRFAEAYPDLTNGFETVQAPVSGGSRPVRIAVESSWMARAVERHRIDVAHHLGGTVPVVRSAPALVTIHDLQPMAMPEHFHPAKRAYLRAAAPHACRVSRRVVTLTRFTRDDVVARTGIPVDRVTLVPPGLDEVGPLADAELVAVRQRYGLGDRPAFLYPAIPYVHKGHHLLLDAFAGVVADHPEALLVLSGGTGPLDPELDEQAHRLGIAASVRRIGRIPWGDLDALYRTVTALVFPSTYEGFGMPTLEAMSRGCPVVASDVGGMTEVVATGGVLLDPRDGAAWRAAMTALLDEPRRRDELVAAGHRQAATFDWDRSAEALTAAWREVAR